MRLSTIAPHPGLTLDLETQAKIITDIKAAPTGSYFLVGPPNTGKSHILTGLFRHALAAWATKSFVEGTYRPAVRRISAAQLLDEHVAWVTNRDDRGSVPLPTVRVNAIQAAAEEGPVPASP
jgi:hypothetical protein